MRYAVEGNPMTTPKTPAPPPDAPEASMGMAEIERVLGLCEAATPGPWNPRREEFDSHAAMAGAFEGTASKGGHVLHFVEHEEKVYPAFTGNGPTSKANAAFIAAARMALPAALADLARVTAERDAAQFDGRRVERDLVLAQNDQIQLRARIAEVEAQLAVRDTQLANMKELARIIVESRDALTDRLRLAEERSLMLNSVLGRIIQIAELKTLTTANMREILATAERYWRASTTKEMP